MIRATLCLVLSLGFIACERTDSADNPPANPPENSQPTPPSLDFNDDGAGVRGRMGAYLENVVPKVKPCWAKLQGTGAIATDMVYRKTGNQWMLDSVRVTRSSLAKGQEATAESCLREAALGSGFAVDANEGLEQAAPRMVVRLGWLIPLPEPNVALTNDQVARLIGPGGGGGGVITVPGCSKCVSNPNYPYGLKCQATKSGSEVDCEEVNSNTCATTPKACFSGVFAGTRGVIMF